MKMVKPVMDSKCFPNPTEAVPTLHICVAEDGKQYAAVPAGTKTVGGEVRPNYKNLGEVPEEHRITGIQTLGHEGEEQKPAGAAAPEAENIAETNFADPKKPEKPKRMAHKPAESETIEEALDDRDYTSMAGQIANRLNDVVQGSRGSAEGSAEAVLTFRPMKSTTTYDIGAAMNNMLNPGHTLSPDQVEALEELMRGDGPKPADTPTPRGMKLNKVFAKT
jgi:hypothetical protein